MDWLDSDLHSAILSSLAANLASTSSHDNLDILTDSFASVKAEPVTNGTISILVNRLGSDDHQQANIHQLSLTEVEGMIGFAEFSAGAIEPSGESLDRVLDLARTVPTVEIDQAIGIQSSHDYAPADRLAHALITATLALTQQQLGNRKQTLKQLGDIQRNLFKQIETASDYRIISHLLPALNGTRRALSDPQFTWTLQDPAPTTSDSSIDLLSRLHSVINADWDINTSDGRTALATIRQYDHSGRGLSPGLVPLCLGESLLGYLASGVGGWDALLHGQPVTGEGTGETKAFVKEAVGGWRGTLDMLERDEEDVKADPYAFDLLLLSLKTATIATIAAGTADNELIEILETVVSEASPVVDELVQAGAIECIQALSHAFSSLGPGFALVLRRFILSPVELLQQMPNLEPAPLLTAAVTAYASILQLSGDGHSQQSAIQSLFNHFTSSAAGSAEDATRSAVSISIIHAVAILGRESRDQSTANLVASMLLQSLKLQDPAVDGAILYELSTLAGDVDRLTFLDIINAVGEAGKSAGLTEAGSGAILSTQTRLARAAIGRSDLHEKYLTEMLTLFVERGTKSAGAGVEKTARTNALLELVPVLDGFLSSPQVNLQSGASPGLVSLFRSFWYLAVLSGFTTTPSRIAGWQREALVRIAKASPGLFDGINDDFVEVELEFNVVLRQAGSGYAITPDSLRAELANTLGAHVQGVKALTAGQVTFLSAILKLESLRAEAGQPAKVISYLHVEGINHSLVGPAIEAVVHRVGLAFIQSFNHSVTTHSIDTGVYKEIKSLVLGCAHPLQHVRRVAIAYLDSLISSFPSLVCNLEVITTLLELLSTVRAACLAEFTDEYTPVYTFTSSRGQFAVVLPDDYAVRNQVLAELHARTKAWLRSSISRAPLEMHGLLQEYIDGFDSDAQSGWLSDDEMGKSVALDLIRTPAPTGRQAGLPAWGNWRADHSAEFARTFAAKSYFGGEASRQATEGAGQLLAELTELGDQFRQHKLHSKLGQIRALLYRAGAYLIHAEAPQVEVLQLLVSLPVRILTEATATIGQEVWTWVADARPELEARLMVELSEAWLKTIEHGQGLFSTQLNRHNPLNQETQYSPTDKEEMVAHANLVTRSLQPHSILLSFIASRFQGFRYRDRDLVMACVRVTLRSTAAYKSWCTHPLARELRMRLVSFGFCVVQASRLESAVEFNLRQSLYKAGLAWFGLRAGWSYGSNRIQVRADLQAVEELHATVRSDQASNAFGLSPAGSGLLPGRVAVGIAANEHAARQKLVLALLENEADRIRLWLNPLMDPSKGPVPAHKSANGGDWRQLVQTAWQLDPEVAIQLVERTKLPAVAADVTRLVRADPVRVQDIPDALQYFIGDSITPDVRPSLRHLLYWSPVPVVSALRFLFPKFKGDPILLQYALRVLEHHPVEVTFFYIPQVVQALRNDALGYAERFIFETSKISQLFCHQIIWNMKANMFRGDDGDVEDPMKPTLERMVDMIVGSLSGEARAFFEREFGFFDEVTSISAKLKPLVGKAGKPEKKAKIDEEMAKIKVDPGVYLPSNPDGVVVDIDRLSGRPLQSHAKAPFMATFKVRRERKVQQQTGDSLLLNDGGEEDQNQSATYDTWQSAIFKVGDDCRQDVLALQLIAMHKNVFTSLGLDLLVTPYRVTATGAGCGVIDVVPNATSRDEMGRAKVNDLKSFFVLKYGSVEGVAFQRARTHFIQSMAAYSLLCYIIQIKDRHNGNIMVDGRGCITHIDFGFLFDIGPGGVKFEPSSFKLSHEMVVLMGGRDGPGFRQFEELTVKAFLAARPYGQAVVDTSALMLAAEFPSFKGEGTMDRLRERFRLDLTEREAAEYMKGVIANACENPRSIVYDEFQRLTNGIPYVR